MATIPQRAVNLAQQLHAITTVLPAANGKIREGKLVCTMPIQPSPASCTYTVRLRYQHGVRPHITVTDPPLDTHPRATALPHVYPGDELCLYYPGQWTHDMILASTVIPWISEWLLHYELWLVTGTWTGGGSTHSIT
jgi:hypothetical protein